MKKSLILGAAILSACCLQMTAKSAPTGASSYPTLIFTTCGPVVEGLSIDVFPSREAYDLYLMNVNYQWCGDMIIPETGTRNPTTEPDNGSNGKKPEEKKK